MNWVCPECGSVKRLGPRPRRNATARYCLPCSEASGSLVERTCPARDRQTARARVNRVARAEVKAEREHEREAQRYTRHGVDFREQLTEIYQLARKLEPSLPKREPAFTMRRRREWVSGRAWYSAHRIVLSVPEEPGMLQTVERLLSQATRILIHEVAHLVAYWRGAEHHDDIFKAADHELTEAHRERQNQKC